MIGFEIEISLPVADINGQPIKGDTHLASSKTVHGDGHGETPIYTLVSDYRMLPSKAPYSNLEFVTKPQWVVADARERGPSFVQNTLSQIRDVRDSLYTTATTASQTLAGTAALKTAATTWLNYSVDGNALLLTPNNGYVEKAGTPGNGDGLFTHYSVGVPLGGLPYFLDRLRTAAPVGNRVATADARHRLVQAKAFATQILGDFKQKGLTDTQARARRELDGYLQYAFTQIVAFADYVATTKDDGQIKNGTVVLSRAILAEVFAHLSTDARNFLRQHVQPLITTLADYQENPFSGPKLQFQDRSSRAIVAHAPVTLEEYAIAAFNGIDPISQERVFGGMREVVPHTEAEAMMIPFEIRTMGSHLKSWQEVSDDLTNLCDWSQTAYELGRP
ncbi:hypothetical protein [Streptomyces microflavus]|uniref:hypothetical protein n=1 Tax=Streptomyces microflavus TaxID=1919 RepID=UPI002E354FE1|nr:hypothetical protein [Streptomyces microflavus]